MAFFEDKKSAGVARPTSARGKTTKEIELEKALKTVRGRVNDRDAKIKKLETEKKQLQRQINSLESVNKKAKAKMEQEQKLRTGAVSEKQQMKAILQKTQRAIAARMMLLGIDFSKCQNIKEALDAALSAINKLITQLEEKEALLKKMEEENAFLKDKLQDYENKMEKMRKKLATQNDTIDEQNNTINEQNTKIENLEKENAQYKEDNERLTNELNQCKDELAKSKDNSSKQFDEMAAKILALQTENVAKSEEIKDLTKLVEELRAQVASQNTTINDQNDELAELRKKLSESEKTIETQTNEIETLRNQIKELEEEIYRLTHIPKEDKAVQTEISGDISTQLGDYPRLLKEIVALRNLLGQKNDFIAKLEEENKELLAEFEDLIKKVVRFYPCSTNHKLEVLAMEASPNRYVMATGSADLSVRLWKIDPDHKKNSKKIIVYQRAVVEGKVDCISWNTDGSLLAAGSGYKDGPDGYVVIWAMTGPNEYNSVYAIRSRPTVRFGRVKSIAFSSRSNQFIYCGDTTGQIWVFDLMRETETIGSGLIGVIQTQRDVINDMALSTNGRFLYSVSCDYTLAVFELPQIFGGDLVDHNTPSSNNKSKNSSKKKRSSNKVSTPTGTGQSKAISLATQTSNTPRHMKSRQQRNSARNLKLSGSQSNQSNKHGRNRSTSKAKSQTVQYTLAEILADESENAIKHYKGVVIADDGKYAFWKVALTPNGDTVVCASRKVRIFNISNNPCENEKENVVKGANISDADLDHVRSLKLRNGQLLLCRTLVPRAKMFDVKTGKEVKKFAMKAPVQAVEFLGDNAHIVICTQEYTAETCDPPVMNLKKISDNRRVIDKVDRPALDMNATTNDNDNDNDDANTPSVDDEKTDA